MSRRKLFPLALYANSLAKSQCPAQVRHSYPDPRALVDIERILSAQEDSVIDRMH